MKVILTDSEYNRSKNVVGKKGNKRYDTLGTLILTEDGTWLYYFKGKEEFEIISED